MRKIIICKIQSITTLKNLLIFDPLNLSSKYSDYGIIHKYSDMLCHLLLKGHRVHTALSPNGEKCYLYIDNKMYTSFENIEEDYYGKEK